MFCTSHMFGRDRKKRGSEAISEEWNELVARVESAPFVTSQECVFSVHVSLPPKSAARKKVKDFCLICGVHLDS